MTVTKTLAERGSRYGAFADHAKIAQGIQDTMRNAPKWDDLDPDMKQALSVIADKIARILNGDPFYGDNWHDIQGYAKLIEDRIEMIPEKDESLYDIAIECVPTRQSIVISAPNDTAPSSSPPLASGGIVARPGGQVLNNIGSNPCSEIHMARFDKSDSSFTNVGQYRG